MHVRQNQQQPSPGPTGLMRKLTLAVWAIIGGASPILPSDAARADALVATQPNVCVAYNPHVDTYGPVGTFSMPHFDGCAPNHAVLALDESSPGGLFSWRRTDPGQLPMTGTCCPLPASDVLIPGVEVFVPSTCPPSFIVTGARSSVAMHRCW